jgi:seryl-tRNA synthetase
MEARAQQSYLGKIKELEDSLSQTQEKLVAMQKQRASAQASVMSPEQQAEVENFKKKAIETRKDLKELRKNLRVESDALQFWTKVANIGLIPLLVVMLGIGLAVARRRKVVTK